MSIAASPKLMTIDEFLALPDDDTERMLIRGVLWEKPMTRRNRYHAHTEARIAHFLIEWLHRQPEPRGDVLSGEAGFILEHNPDSGVGIDVAYVSPETAARQTDADTTMIDGPPVLAVEILSPNDTQKEVHAKIADYLASGVAVVWVVDPIFQTVTVYRQQQHIDRLERELKVLRDQVEAASAACEPGTSRGEIPPHY